MSGVGSFTIIVIPLLSGPALEACLQRLSKILQLDRVECLVVLADGEDAGDISTWRRRYPTVRFLSASQPAVPLRRRQGVEAAHGEFVALIEDTSCPGPGWYEALSEGFDKPEVAAVCGPVEVSRTLPSRFQALGYTEYGRFHPCHMVRGKGPARTEDALRPARRLPGNNLAYRRAPLLEALLGSNGGLFEADVNERLRSQGFQLLMHPTMLVTYCGADHHGARLSTRFQHGRLYAARRSAGRSWLVRLTLLAKSVTLPVILPARALSTVFRALPLSSIPRVALWIGLLEGAWALGEAVGYLAGEGNALESWR